MAESPTRESGTVNPTTSSQAAGEAETRRDFLGVSSAAMAAGLAAGYGALGYSGARFLMPTDSGLGEWQFVATVAQLAQGHSLQYTSPAGQRVVVARQSNGEDADAFIALSSVCPHLGCQVHWESVENRFFCPCHNGAFDPSGNPTAGPPFAAKTPLSRFPLKVERGVLFIQVPTQEVVPRPTAEAESPREHHA